MALTINKKGKVEILGYDEILKRVKKVNKTLVQAGYSASKIEKFWEECRLEARHGSQTRIEF